MVLKLALLALVLSPVTSVARSQNGGDAAVALFSSLTPPRQGLWEDKMTNADGTSETYRACRKGDPHVAFDAMRKVFANCTFSNTAHTSTSLSFDMSCKMQSVNSSGHFEVSEPTPEKVHSVMRMSIIMQGKTMPMDSTTDSRFISEDCGSLQPKQMQKVQ